MITYDHKKTRVCFDDEGDLIGWISIGPVSPKEQKDALERSKEAFTDDSPGVTISKNVTLDEDPQGYR